MNGLMPALFSTNRPRASGLVRLDSSGIVFAFAMGESDRVYRREVKNVKAHSCDVRQYFFAVLEPTVRSGKHFIPRAEPSAYGIDRQTKLFVVSGAGAVCISRSKNRQTVVDVLYFQILAKMLQLLRVDAAG